MTLAVPSAAGPLDSEFSVTDDLVQTIFGTSVGDYFVSYLPCSDARLKAVFWQLEGPMLRVWTVIDGPDFDFESSIYAAEASFLQKFPDIQADFYVAFQQGRPLASVTPAQAVQAYPRA